MELYITGCMFAGHDTVVESVEIAVACKAQHSTYRIR